MEMLIKSVADILVSCSGVNDDDLSTSDFNLVCVLMTNLIVETRRASSSSLMPWFAEKSVMDDEFDNVVFCFYLYICLAFLLFPYL